MLHRQFRIARTRLGRTRLRKRWLHVWNGGFPLKAVWDVDLGSRSRLGLVQRTTLPLKHRLAELRNRPPTVASERNEIGRSKYRRVGIHFGDRGKATVCDQLENEPLFIRESKGHVGSVGIVSDMNMRAGTESTPRLPARYAVQMAVP